MKAAKEWLAQLEDCECGDHGRNGAGWPTEEWIRKIQIDAVRSVGERLIGVKVTPESIGDVFRRVLAEMQGA
jgi:hypothetical protein